MWDSDDSSSIDYLINRRISFKSAQLRVEQEIKSLEEQIDKRKYTLELQGKLSEENDKAIQILTDYREEDKT